MREVSMKNYLQKFFLAFDTAMINDLVSIAKMETYTKDSILFFEGESAKRLYLLAKGSVYEYKSEHLQRLQVVRYFQPLCLIGELSVITGSTYPTSLRCERDSRIISIDFERYMQLFCYDQHRGRLGYSYLLNSIVDKYEYHLNSCCYSCTQSRHFSAQMRVAKYIYEDLDTFNKDKKFKTAQLLRISPETLSRSIQKLKRKELIKMVGTKIVISDMQKLREFII